MAAKTKWQDSDARKQQGEAARKAGDEAAAAQLLQQSRELLEAARGILYSANIANSGGDYALTVHRQTECMPEPVQCCCSRLQPAAAPVSDATQTTLAYQARVLSATEDIAF